MDKIYRQIVLNTANTENYYVSFCLTNTFALSGVMDDLSDVSTDNPYQYQTVTITGNSLSRLESCLTYDPQNPYVVGVNGVTAVNMDPQGNLYSVEYTLLNVQYITYVQQQLYTTFSLVETVLQLQPNSNLDLVKRDFLDGSIATPYVTSNIYVQRQEVSIFEPHYRLAMVANLDDVMDYGGGAYFTTYQDI